HPQPGQVIAGRRVPTKEEIARINAALAAFEAGRRGPDGATPAPVVVAPPAGVGKPVGDGVVPKADKPKGGAQDP
ncbi:MAG TPA: hypothetical protein VF459_18590, partial [Caulobacteraceae bacterium]